MRTDNSDAARRSSRRERCDSDEIRRTRTQHCDLGATMAREAAPGREGGLMIAVRRVMLLPEEMRKL